MRNVCVIVFLLVSLLAAGQDLNGVWRGKLTQLPGGCFPEYNIELHMNFVITANTMSGKAYDYFDTSRYVKLDFIGRYNANTKRMVLMENDLLASHIPESCVPCVKTYDLTWSKSGNQEVLIGECRGREWGGYSPCPGYKVILTRVAKPDFPVEVEQSPDMAEQQKKLKLQPRSKEIVKAITVNAPEIKLDFYDNAEIDNDTITVLLNGNLLLYRKMLTAKPLTITFNAAPNTDYELVMYADNLGTIPPNTALLVITAGAKKYEVRMASSEEKSAAIKFRYEPPPK